MRRKVSVTGGMFVVGLLAVVAAIVLVSQSTPSRRRFTAVPLGPEAETHLAVPGAMNVAPSLAARWPFVVLAWTARTAIESAVYVASSTDNGASFSRPRRIVATVSPVEAVTILGPRVVLGPWRTNADYEPVMPDVHVVWHVGAGQGARRRAAKSVDAGRSFVDEPMDDDQPADLPRPGPRTPGLAQWREAFAEAPPAHLHGAYDECGTLLAVWDDASSGVPRVVMRRFVEDNTGAEHALQTVVVSGASPASHPTVASVLGGVIVAWTSGTVPAPVIALRRIGLESICQARPNG
ncbi:MAG: hypothetical protein ABUS56_10965 [Acidobacteriota bacterium]